MLVKLGSRVHYRTIASGVFHCERCGGDRPYRHRTGRRWAQLLGVPLFPLDATGEHLRCTICRTCYRVELLAVPTIEQMQKAMCGATTVAVLAMLSAGGSVSQVARRRAVEVIIEAGSAEYGDSDLVLALGEATATRGSAPGLRSVLETFAIQLQEHASEWFLAKIVQVGLADGLLSAAEREVALAIARYLGLSQAKADDVIQLAEEAAQAG